MDPPPQGDLTETTGHRSRHGCGNPPGSLLPETVFYSVLRRRVGEYLKRVGHADGGPTKGCVRLFWFCVALWVLMWGVTLTHGSIAAAVGLGLASSLLGAFGHNWVHQPKYKGWAFLSLDCIGFSSDGWFREHNLQVQP